MDTPISPIRLAEASTKGGNASKTMRYPTDCWVCSTGSGNRTIPKATSLPHNRRSPARDKFIAELAEIFAEAAADPCNTPGDGALLAEKGAQFRALACIAEEKAEARLLN